VVAWLAGLGVVLSLVLAQGAGEIAAALALVGASAGLPGIAHLATLLADTLGWRALLRPAARPSLAALLWQRWIGASIKVSCRWRRSAATSCAPACSPAAGRRAPPPGRASWST
jgi:hypothetical protein